MPPPDDDSGSDTRVVALMRSPAFAGSPSRSLVSKYAPYATASGSSGVTSPANTMPSVAAVPSSGAWSGWKPTSFGSTRAGSSSVTRTEVSPSVSVVTFSVTIIPSFCTSTDRATVVAPSLAVIAYSSLMHVRANPRLISVPHSFRRLEIVS